MEQEREDYSDDGPRSRLPTPAALAGCVLIVVGGALTLIVAGFIVAVVLVQGSKPAP
jgi:hypothetical protein